MSAQPITTMIPSPTLELSFGETASSYSAANGPTAQSGRDESSSTVPAPGPQSLRDVSLGVRDRVQAFLERDADGEEAAWVVQKQVRTSMEIIQEALARYGPDHLALSYNGGKDCLVVLLLLLACLPTWEEDSSAASAASTAAADGAGASGGAPATISAPPSPSSFPAELQALYVISPNPFLEVQDFVASSAHTYQLDLVRYSASMRAALAEYLLERPKVRAVFVGTRRTDPHGEQLTHFDPTDEGWPACIRVHPVIDWHYTEIWTFIRALGIPFCKLYEMGYTSLGGMNDTRPNPALAVPGSSSEFRPAYELVSDDQERLGREVKEDPPPPASASE